MEYGLAEYSNAIPFRPPNKVNPPVNPTVLSHCLLSTFFISCVLIEEDTNIIESVLLNRPNPALEFIQLKISGIKYPGLYEAC
jgi:hypothetical protein